jgi:diaminopimelate epimerase
MIRVGMGYASFRGEDALPAGRGGGAGCGLDLGDDAGRAAINTVSLANPHCVVFVGELVREDFLRRAPRLCRHPAFRAGTNVPIRTGGRARRARGLDLGAGRGETRPRGRACAAAAAAVRRGLLRPGSFEVRMRGGSADVEISDTHSVRLRGPARMVFAAHIDAAQLAARRAWTRTSPGA